MLLLAGLKNQLKQKKTRRIHREKVEQAARDTVAGLTAAANAVVLLSTWSIMTGAETRRPTPRSQLDSNLYMARLPQDTQVQSEQATLSGAHADCHTPGTNI